MKKLLIARLKDHLLYESRTIRTIIANIGILAGYALLMLGKPQRGLAVLGAIHRGAFSRTVDKVIETHIKKALSGPTSLVDRNLRQAIEQYPFVMHIDRNLERFDANPQDLLGACVMILKNPKENEKGILYCFYSYVYPLLIRNFDMRALMERYRIAIEPSWSGYCDPNILCLGSLNEKIAVGVAEERDARFLKNVCSNLIPTDFAGNTWINTDLFAPKSRPIKKYDVVMVAAWAWYKRHWAFFKCLKEIRQSGHQLRIALIGYPIDMTREEIASLAQYYGVIDMIEIFQNIPQAEVAELVAASRCMVLWSRREGSPRAIIESMAADVPCIIREGFNYGQHYRHINPLTGRFASEETLGHTIMDILKSSNTLNPRKWILENMTPKTSIKNLNALMKSIGSAEGEEWTEEAVAKTNGLHGMEYLNPLDSNRFESAYQELRSLIKADRKESKSAGA